MRIVCPTVYAPYVHENLQARHEPPYGQGGKAKFMEDPFNRIVPSIPGHLADRIQAAIEEAVG
jgi:hypothetical protein